MTEIPQEKIGEWYFAASPREYSWVGMAKRADPFVNGDPIHEPGEVWFGFGETEDEALAAVKEIVLT
jgi:hypothetical protein